MRKMANIEKKTLFGVEVYITTKNEFMIYTTLLGKIIISTEVFNSLSEQSLKTVIMHERFHQRINKTKEGRIINLINGILLIIVSFLIILNFALLVVNYIHILKIGDETCIISSIILFIAILLVNIYYRRNQERAADIYSAKEVGKEYAIAGFKELKEKSPHNEKISIIKDPFYFVTHGKWEDRINFIAEL